MAHDDETTRYTHPSYGIIGFNRVSCGGNTRLFGSALDQHYHTIRVRIGRAERATEHGLDRFRSLSEIIEIELSAAQFAEAITAMNVGDGVPCTIRRLTGQGRIEDPPYTPNASDHAKIDFKARMRTFADSLATLRKDVERATEGKTITAAVRATIRDGVNAIATEVSSNLPFFVECYEEAVTKVSAAAKAEADAWLTAAIHRAGLGALRSQLPGAAKGEEHPVLPPAEE
jgi:hypothetical protein